MLKRRYNDLLSFKKMSKLIYRPNTKSNAANFTQVGVNRKNKFRKFR